jgi:hypothetical protein
LIQRMATIGRIDAQQETTAFVNEVPAWLR